MSVGKIESFDVASGNWTLYVERLEQYFIINAVTEDKTKIATLITVMGASAYELLVTLCDPTKPSSKTFKELVDVMTRHLQPKPSILAERYKFRQRKQRSDESIADYLASLRKLASTCDFKTGLEENLRDQLTCGIYSEGTRQRFFAEEDINLKKAFKISQALEAATKDAAVVREPKFTATETVCHAITYGRGARGRGFAKRALVPGTAGPDRQQSSGAGAAGGPYTMSGSQGTGACIGGGGAAGGTQSLCYVCGGTHQASSCKFRVYVCRICNRQGHLKKMCPNIRKITNSNYVEDTTGRTDTELSDDEVTCYNFNDCKSYKPYVISLQVNGKPLHMEVDTGSTISCISYECYCKLFSDCKLLQSNLILRYYTGEKVSVMGKIQPIVKYNEVVKTLNLYVLRNARTSLVGREWLENLKISLSTILYNSVSTNVSVFNINMFSSRYCEVFADGLGRFTGEPVSLRLREGAQPVFMRARPLPFAMREPVERTIDQMVSDGIITPVETSDWATPIVPVVKSDGTIRICADFKLTLNKWIEVDRYPVPRIEDLLAKLNGGTKFSKIDLSQAYAQFPLDDSKICTTINTHKGLFQYNRLVYGLASSPGIFQRKLEQMFADLPTVGVYLDDVIITALDDEKHIQILHTIFERLQKYGLRIKKEKCTFFADSVTYLGYIISKNGIATCPDKVQAIQNIPIPSNITELRSFIGMCMYYGKFVKNISSILSPLYELLKNNVTFHWSIECQNSFDSIKGLLVSSGVLAHYSVELPLVLTTDASSVGAGAVISHLLADGQERPVAYASRVLNAAERGYSQIEKEALAIIYGVKKFHQYLYGRRFILRTDHKPLVSIFGSKSGIPTMAASRLQRWAVILSGYAYEIEYVSSENNGADALSRLPTGARSSEKADVTYLNFIQKFLPIKCVDVKDATTKDDILKKVQMYIVSGWPSHCSDDRLRPFYARRNELYLEAGCIMWGYRVVVPDCLRENILKELHTAHMGMVKMKSLARSYVWWPGVDEDVERVCRECGSCTAEAGAPPRAKPQHWPFVSEPWSRIHIDFLGPLEGQSFLILVDSTTKWIEAFRMQYTTAAAVIRVLRETFARFGLPREIVSDNGPQFHSSELAEFFDGNGIRHTFTASYHPASNGAAENAVKLCKKALKKAKRDKLDIDAALQTYLMAHRNAIHSTTGQSPASLLQRRTLRSRLDLLRGARALEESVGRAQCQQARAAPGTLTPRRLASGDLVWAREHANPDRWAKGIIREVIGSRIYVVEKEDGSSIRKHVDQLKLRVDGINVGWPNALSLPTPSATSHSSDDRQPSIGSEVAGRAQTLEPGARTTIQEGPPVSRFGRVLKPVIRFPDGCC